MACRKRFLFFIVQFFAFFLFGIFFVSSSDAFQPTGFSFYSEGNVSFFVSHSQAITVLRDTFDGQTTNFTEGGNLGLESIEDMTLEDFGYGTVLFNQIINLTQDAYSPTGSMYNRVVDLDSNFLISTNFISVNHSALQSLNKSATISIYSVYYDSPVILRNGFLCPSNVCTLVSYSGGTAIFNVSYLEHSSSITTYSIAETGEAEPFCGDDECNGAETCSTCSADCGACPEEPEGGGGGGGGGGGSISGREVIPSNRTSSLFYVEPTLIEMDIEKGNYYLKKVTLFNKGATNLSVSVSASPTISRFVKIDEKSFILEKGKSREYSFHIYSSVRNDPDLYTGKLLFESESSDASVDLIVRVQELPALFDIKLTSVKRYVLPEGIALADIKFSNVGDAEVVEAQLEYGIMDFNNTIHVSRTEKVIVLRDVTEKRVSLKLPDGLEMGRYIFYSKIKYEDKIAVSNDTFQIERISFLLWIILLILLLVLMLLIIFAIILVKRRKKEKEMQKTFTGKEEENKIRNLVQELLGEMRGSGSK